MTGMTMSTTAITPNHVTVADRMTGDTTDRHLQPVDGRYTLSSAAEMSAASVGRTMRATSCPSRSNISVGHSLTR